MAQLSGLLRLTRSRLTRSRLTRSWQLKVQVDQVDQVQVDQVDQSGLPELTKQVTQCNGVEYGIPPLWKRLAAESIDFLLLFAIKLVVTFAAVDAFDLLLVSDKGDIENICQFCLGYYKLRLDKVIIKKVFHCGCGAARRRALCLHRGSGGSGGATPGKKLLGLRVVRCEWAAPTLGERALVFPSTDLGFGRAVVRSVVKNFSLTFLFPICFTLFAFQHNRTVYDIIAGSIVVEDLPNQRNMVRRNN
ncbi:unnamed protein product, partial [Meganyctiphanes norvegica]